MRSKDGADYRTCIGRVANRRCDDNCKHKGEGKRQKAEGRGLMPGLVELFDVDLEPGKEHQEELAKLGKEADDLAVGTENRKHIRAKDNSRNNISDRPR